MKAATVNVSVCKVFAKISIHAAREGGDVLITSEICGVVQFQSTPPVKAATIKIWFYAFSVIISIHAAREGGDAKRVLDGTEKDDFNPRRP